MNQDVGEVWITDRHGRRHLALVSKGGLSGFREVVAGLPGHRLARWHRKLSCRPLPAELGVIREELARRNISGRAGDQDGQLLMFQEPADGCR